MPSVGASVDGISDSLVFLRLVVEVVEEVEELLARVDGGVMAQQCGSVLCSESWMLK